MEGLNFLFYLLGFAIDFHLLKWSTILSIIVKVFMVKGHVYLEIIFLYAVDSIL